MADAAEYMLPGPLAEVVRESLRRLSEERIPARIWGRDHTVWKPDPADVANRLGWVDAPVRLRGLVPATESLVGAVRREGLRTAVLAGMGGSSLASEMFRKTFGVADGYLDLIVADSTHPDAVAELTSRLNPAETLWLIASKSGGTVETLALCAHFWGCAVDGVGPKSAGGHFMAITDPRSGLEAMALELGFRMRVLGDPDIGGRYSALSMFGLLPACLVGVDIGRLLDRARAMAERCGPDVPAADNPAARLGATLAAAARAGRDKLTLIMSPALGQSFADWVEQLVAESLGKAGQGILPVVGEPLPDGSESYGADRIFVAIDLDGDLDAAPLEALHAAGHPVVRLSLDNVYDIGGQIYLCELATAVVGHLLGVNPFDQPNVESAKVRARELVAAFREQGTLPEQTPALEADGVAVYGDVSGSGPGEALASFVSGARPPAYLALQAYLPPSQPVDAALGRLRLALRERLGMAVTSGYGPRFLHSTGQLHKGDAGRGLFVQITSEGSRDLSFPDEPGSATSSVSFGVLVAAQAMGDRVALTDAGRKVLRLHLGQDIVAGLDLLCTAP